MKFPQRIANLPPKVRKFLTICFPLLLALFLLELMAMVVLTIFCCTVMAGVYIWVFLRYIGWEGSYKDFRYQLYGDLDPKKWRD